MTDINGEGIQPFMIGLIQQQHGTGLSNATIAKHINKEFNTNFTEKDVNLYFEPTIEEDVEDLRMIYANIN